MHLVWMLLAVCAFPCLMAASSSRKFGETLFVGLGGIMTCMYLFAILGKMQAGFYAVCVLLLGCYGAAAGILIRRKAARRTFLRRFITPGFGAYLLLLAALWAWTRGVQPALWDEMRLWAAYPKAVFLTNELQLGAESVIFEEMQNYLPGLMLMQVFFQKLQGTWNEQFLYIVHFMLGFSFLLPAAESEGRNRWLLCPVCALVFFALPMTFFNSSMGLGDYGRIYETLVSDIPLSLCFAVSLWLGWKSLGEKRQSWLTVQYACALLMLMLIKESGLLLSFFSLALLTVFRLLRTRKEGGLFRQLMMPLIGLACVLLVKITWSRVLDAWQVAATGSWISADLLQRILHPTEAEKATILDAVNHLTGMPLVESAVFGVIPRSPWAYLMAAFAGLILLFACLVRREKRAGAVTLLLGAFCINCAYALSLIPMFTFAWGAVLSYIRYISTMMLSCLAVTVMLVLSVTKEQGWKHKWVPRAVLPCLAAVCALVFPFEKADAPDYVQEASALRKNAVVQAADAVGDAPERGFINLYGANIATEDTDLMHQQMYYYLLDHHIAIRNMYQDGRMLESGFASDEARNEYLKALFFDRAFGNYDYFYLDSVSDHAYLSEYASFFEGGEKALRDGGVYSIGLKDGQVRFVPCGV